MALQLPSELIGLLFLHLSNNHDTLKQCSLVCKDWAPYAREYLFRSWKLRPMEPHETFSSEELDFLGSAYTVHVRWLFVPLAFLGSELHCLTRLTNIDHLHLSLRFSVSILHQYSHYILSLLPLQSIAKLTLSDVEINGTFGIPNILGAFPALESLKLISIFAVQTSSTLHSTDIFPKLKRLKCQENVDPTSRIALFDWLASDNGRESFPSLNDISIRNIGEHEIPALGILFHALGPKLSKLSATLSDAISPALVKEHLDLGRNSTLRSITVRFRFYHRSVSVLGPSLILLQSASASLEDITIKFDGSMSIKKVSKVGWSLMDNTLSDPSFTKLRRIAFLLSAPENPVNQLAVNDLRARLPKISSGGIAQWGRSLVTRGPSRRL
ncbi:hypothetical protein BD779DRAFT_1546233 [Infundibulicybe gibba]|nr:hypothetical protein BD779DRAFT_1546233 [Infundibulicybe gibba]